MVLRPNRPESFQGVIYALSAWRLARSKIAAIEAEGVDYYSGCCERLLTEIPKDKRRRIPATPETCWVWVSHLHLLLNLVPRNKRKLFKSLKQEVDAYLLRDPLFLCNFAIFVLR